VGISGARKVVSVFAENVFVFARRCYKGLIEVRRG
jgi:hypothetical protein